MSTRAREKKRLLGSSEKAFLKKIFPVACINYIPIVGVIFFGWNIQSIVELYWVESFFVGIFNFLRLARWNAEKAPRLALFFLIHYTFFVVISTLFLKEVYPTFMQGFGQGQWYLFSVQSILKMLLEIPVSYLGVFLGYAVSFIKEVRTVPRQRPGEYFRYTSLAYARIFVMQLTCMFGARIANFFGVPVFALFCMIAIKIFVDFLFLQKGNSAANA